MKCLNICYLRTVASPGGKVDENTSIQCFTRDVLNSLQAFCELQMEAHSSAVEHSRPTGTVE
eukprot:9299049-Ditylum_brightwellii.AAC.1